MRFQPRRDDSGLHARLRRRTAQPCDCGCGDRGGAAVLAAGHGPRWVGARGLMACSGDDRNWHAEGGGYACRLRWRERGRSRLVRRTLRLHGQSRHRPDRLRPGECQVSLPGHLRDGPLAGRHAGAARPVVRPDAPGTAPGPGRRPPVTIRAWPRDASALVVADHRFRHGCHSARIRSQHARSADRGADHPGPRVLPTSRALDRRATGRAGALRRPAPAGRMGLAAAARVARLDRRDQHRQRLRRIWRSRGAQVGVVRVPTCRREARWSWRASSRSRRRPAFRRRRRSAAPLLACRRSTRYRRSAPGRWCPRLRHWR